MYASICKHMHACSAWRRGHRAYDRPKGTRHARGKRTCPWAIHHAPCAIGMAQAHGPQPSRFWGGWARVGPGRTPIPHMAGYAHGRPMSNGHKRPSQDGSLPTQNMCQKMFNREAGIQLRLSGSPISELKCVKHFDADHQRLPPVDKARCFACWAGPSGPGPLDRTQWAGPIGPGPLGWAQGCGYRFV